MMLKRYYLTQRPAGPGTIPDGATKVVNFDERMPVPGVGHAWGYVEYEKYLDFQQVKDYELKQIDMTREEFQEYKNAYREATGMNSAYEAERAGKKLLFVYREMMPYGDMLYYVCPEDGTIYHEYYSIGD